MGIYTVLDDKRVDAMVEKDLEHIVKGVTEEVSARAIVLGGGFGRGEGSVIVDDEGIRPVNDYDVFVVVPDDDRTDFRGLGRRMAKEVGIRLLDLIPIKHSKVRTLPPNQFNYDLKYGGTHLWGENVLEMIPEYREGHVEPGAARTLLLNRLICAIEAFSEEFEGREMTAEEKFFLVNQTCKVVSACVEALLIRKKRYHHSYQRRMKVFEAEFPGKKGLIGLNRAATGFKLRPTADPGLDAVSFWKKAVSEYLEVLPGFLLPDPSATAKGLWKALKTEAVTKTPVERVELMLLLYRELPFLSRGKILARAREELGSLVGAPLHSSGWEELRARAARLWHELYH